MVCAQAGSLTPGAGQDIAEHSGPRGARIMSGIHGRFRRQRGQDACKRAVELRCCAFVCSVAPAARGCQRIAREHVLADVKCDGTGRVPRCVEKSHVQGAEQHAGAVLNGRDPSAKGFSHQRRFCLVREYGGSCPLNQFRQTVRVVVVAMRHGGAGDAHIVLRSGGMDRGGIPRRVDDQCFGAGDPNDVAEVPERAVP